MAQNYILLERIELNQSASSVTFASIPQTGYTDLKIVWSGRNSTTTQWASLAFNGSTTGFSGRYLQGDGASAVSGTQANANNFALLDTSSNTANTFSNGEMYIPNYTSANYKSISIDMVQEDNAATAYSRMSSFVWSNTAAITSITFTAISSSSFAQYSTFSLYGIANASTTPAIAPKADGGNVIATDGTYWYHAFLSNGTFTPQVGLSADVLVVAGGGGAAGSDGGGGGGAGGLLAFTSQTLTATGYTCTVGAGGAGTNAYINGVSGSNSQFGALTASVGGGGGGYYQKNGLTGGSGGGGGRDPDPVYAGGAATSGQGNAGGAATIGASYVSASGGGGAGAAGGNTSTQGNSGVGDGGPGGAGGAGLNTWSSWASATGTGVSGYYAGGGGGAAYIKAGGAAGAGGGGAGGSSAAGTSGTANTGGGGGGGLFGAGGSGGSGIVIIRYAV